MNADGETCNLIVYSEVETKELFLAELNRNEALF